MNSADIQNVLEMHYQDFGCNPPTLSEKSYCEAIPPVRNNGCFGAIPPASNRLELRSDPPAGKKTEKTREHGVGGIMSSAKQSPTVSIASCRREIPCLE